MPVYSVLKKRRDFVRLTKQGESYAAKSLVLQAMPSSLSTADGRSRIGYTTTKKIGKAHIRNRCRRRLRAVTAMFFDKYALPDFDYVLVARYNTANIGFDILCRDFITAVQKVNRRFVGESANANQNDTAGVSVAD